jgi:hypothetical protein
MVEPTTTERKHRLAVDHISFQALRAKFQYHDSNSNNNYHRKVNNNNSNNNCTNNNDNNCTDAIMVKGDHKKTDKNK